MRIKEKQRVVCTSCGWSGGRKASDTVLDTPCFKCGAPVEKSGGVYVEDRVVAGCVTCPWWGEIPRVRLGVECTRCDGGVIVQAYVVDEAGTVLS